MNAKDRQIKIANTPIGHGHPCYIIANISSTHGGSFDNAMQLLREAIAAGAGAVKMQAYDPDRITLDSMEPCFRISENNRWKARNLYELFKKSHTPWDWLPRLQREAENLGLDFFCTSFDESAVDFLEELEVPAHKVSSYELSDLPFLRRVGSTGKPVLLSTGMASLQEIDEAIKTLRDSGTQDIIPLKCTSAYPAPPQAMNLATIPHLRDAFQLPVGLSDHSLGLAAPVVAVTLGACLVEKHLILSRSQATPEAEIALEPREFGAMVWSVRQAEQSLGQVQYGLNEYQQTGLAFRRSLFVVQDMKKGQVFCPSNCQSIRPGCGLPPRFLPLIFGRQAAVDVKRGTPLTLDLVT